MRNAGNAKECKLPYSKGPGAMREENNGWSRKKNQGQVRCPARRSSLGLEQVGPVSEREGTTEAV